jgi:hypothetical protein
MMMPKAKLRTSDLSARALEQFLKDPQLRELARLLARAHEFNVFDVMKNSEFEIRHSNILAWLLDPQGSHGLKDSFLMGFIQTAHLQSRLARKLLNAGDIQARREEGFIDIIIRSINAKTIIVIENKIWTDEAIGQLKGYREKIERQQGYEDYDKVFIYLTPEGRRPSDPLWVSVSYKQVYELVERILNGKKGADTRAKDFLRQYQYMLETSVLGDFKLNDNVRSLLTSQKELIESLCSLQGKDVKEFGKLLQKAHLLAPAIKFLVNRRSRLVEDLFGYLENAITRDFEVEKEKRWKRKNYAGFSFQTPGLTKLNKTLMTAARQEDYLMAYEAGMGEDYVNITLYVLPGKGEVRKMLLRLAKDSSLRGEGGLNMCIPVFKYHKIYQALLLSREDLIIMNFAQAEEKLRSEFRSFIQVTAPLIEASITDGIRHLGKGQSD